jgi:hypothetical protein
LSINDLRFLDRLFLRHCALLIRLYGRDDAEWIWIYASIGVNIFLGSVVASGLALIAVLFREALPPYLNPIVASKEVLYVQFGAVAMLALVFVDYRFRAFKHDVSAAHSFKTGKDMLKLALEWIFQLCCLAAMGLAVGHYRSAIVVA